jgi:light-regulated signal transduction histidine kinase (bacteriophytochrome)
VQEPPEGLDEFEKLIVFDAFNVSTLISRIDFALNQIESFTDNLSDETEAITIKDQAGKIRSLFTSQRDFNMEQELNDFQLSMSTLGFVSAHLKHDQQQAIDAALDRIATTMDCEMVSVEGSPGRRLIFNE